MSHFILREFSKKEDDSLKSPWVGEAIRHNFLFQNLNSKVDNPMLKFMVFFFLCHTSHREQKKSKAGPGRSNHIELH